VRDELINSRAPVVEIYRCGSSLRLQAENLLGAKKQCGLRLRVVRRQNIAPLIISSH
jgi:hypothetical protein